MYDLINAITDHPKTPAHLRQYLDDHVDTDTQDGLALFDVLRFTRILTTTYPAAHEMFGHNGQPFRQLAEIIIQGLQATPDYERLQELIFTLSQKLEPHKDEHGYVEVDGLTIEEAEHWVAMFRQEKNRHSLKELRA